MAVAIFEYLEGIAHRQLQEYRHGGDGVVQSHEGDHVRMAGKADRDRRTRNHRNRQRGKDLQDKTENKKRI